MAKIFTNETAEPKGNSNIDVTKSTSTPAKNENTLWGSQINNPKTMVKKGTGTAQTGIDNADDYALTREGDETQADTQQYVQQNEDYGVTPESLQDRYNTTGVGTRNTRKLSRLVDALNARDWGTTRAAGQFDNSGMSHSNAGWVTLPAKELDTAEARAQRRAEGYEAQLAQSAIGRDDMLRRMAPELWQLKETLTTQFASQLDNTQVNAVNQAISLLFNETLQEFSNKETIRHALQLADVLSTLPGEVQAMVMNAIIGTPQMSRMQAKLSEEWNQLLMKINQQGGNLTADDVQNYNNILMFNNTGFGAALANGAAFVGSAPSTLIDKYKDSKKQTKEKK